jgi:hypothetical protein
MLKRFQNYADRKWSVPVTMKKMPRFIWADYADGQWAFYTSRREKESNRPDLRGYKIKIEDIEEVEELRTEIDRLKEEIRSLERRHR